MRIAITANAATATPISTIITFSQRTRARVAGHRGGAGEGARLVIVAPR
jgi:hypothetical protein